MGYAPYPSHLPANMISILLLIVIVAAVAAIRKRGMGLLAPTLVLKQLHIDANGANNLFLNITGRRAGLIAWLLTRLRLDTEMKLMVTNDRVLFKSTSFFGENHSVMPLPSVESTQCGYIKPFIWIVVGIFLILGSLGAREDAVMLIGMVLGALSIVSYFFSKKMYISLSAGQSSIAIAFKKGVIENIPVTLEKALEAITVLNDRAAHTQMARNNS